MKGAQSPTDAHRNAKGGTVLALFIEAEDPNVIVCGSKHPHPLPQELDLTFTRLPLSCSDSTTRMQQNNGVFSPLPQIYSPVRGHIDLTSGDN